MLGKAMNFVTICTLAFAILGEAANHYTDAGSGKGTAVQEAKAVSEAKAIADAKAAEENAALEGKLAEEAAAKEAKAPEEATAMVEAEASEVAKVAEQAEAAAKQAVAFDAKRVATLLLATVLSASATSPAQGWGGGKFSRNLGTGGAGAMDAIAADLNRGDDMSTDEMKIGIDDMMGRVGHDLKQGNDDAVNEALGKVEHDLKQGNERLRMTPSTKRWAKSIMKGKKSKDLVGDAFGLMGAVIQGGKEAVAKVDQAIEAKVARRYRYAVTPWGYEAIEAKVARSKEAFEEFEDAVGIRQRFGD